MRQIKPTLVGTELRVAIVRARFNESIGAGLLAACTERSVAPKPQYVSGECRAAASPTSTMRGDGERGAGLSRDHPGMYPKVARWSTASPRLYRGSVAKKRA